MVRQTKIGQAQSGVVVVGIVWRLPIAHANNEMTRKVRRSWHHFLSSNVLRLSSCLLFSFTFAARDAPLRSKGFSERLKVRCRCCNMSSTAKIGCRSDHSHIACFGPVDLHHLVGP